MTIEWSCKGAYQSILDGEKCQNNGLRLVIDHPTTACTNSNYLLLRINIHFTASVLYVDIYI